MAKCEKTSYGDKKYADEHLKIIREKRKYKGGPIRSYKCDKCHRWHLTSLPDYKQEIGHLKKEIRDKDDRIFTLQHEVKIMQSVDAKVQMMAIKKDEVVKSLKKQIEEKNTTITKLRKDIEKLICQLNA